MEQQIKNLTDDTEIWLFDFSNQIPLLQSMQETQQNWFEKLKSIANYLGILRIKKIDGQIWRHFFDFISEDTQHDAFFVISCFEKLLQNMKEKQELPKYIFGWSDCGISFYI